MEKYESMEKMKKIISILSCVFSLIIISKLSPTTFILSYTSMEVVALTGTATFYNPPYVLSACNGNKDEGVMIGAASDAIWDDGAACGRKYKVKCEGGTNEGPHPCRGSKYVVVKIVSYCPPGCEGTIDLSREAFEAIADLDAAKSKYPFISIFI